CWPAVSASTHRTNSCTTRKTWSIDRQPRIHGKIVPTSGPCDVRCSIHFFQHPQASGCLRDRQTHPFRCNGQIHAVDILRQHQTWSLKRRHLEWLANRLTLFRIEMKSENVEKANSARYHIDRFSVRRPPRLVTPFFFERDSGPGSSINRR